MFEINAIIIVKDGQIWIISYKIQTYLLSKLKHFLNILRKRPPEAEIEEKKHELETHVFSIIIKV